MTARLSLEHVTAWGLSPVEIADLAEELGCEVFSLFVETPTPETAEPTIVSDRALREALRSRLASGGPRLHTIECFAFVPETRVEDFVPALEVGAELGGRAASAIVFDPEPSRVIERFGAFAELARGFGVAANVEFLAQSSLPSLAAAVELTGAAGVPGTGVVVDSLHWTRSGGTVEQLQALDPAVIGWIQLCDGPVEMAVDKQLVYEGLYQRQIPGEGVFALHDFITALPPDRVIGVEVPLKNLGDQGIPIAERARRAVAGSRRVLAASGYGEPAD